jgi:CheY-like chemotaxis protein
MPRIIRVLMSFPDCQFLQYGIHSGEKAHCTCHFCQYLPCSGIVTVHPELAKSNHIRLRYAASESIRVMAKTTTKVKRFRLILADDHQTVLDTVATMLATEFTIAGTAHDGGALLEAVRNLDPDLVVLDISMPVYNGLEVARRLRERGCRAKLVFLTVHDDEDFVHEALSAGAAGYVIKASMAVDLVHAIREALAGRTYISPSIAITGS